MKFERLYVSTITGALVTLVDGREREIEAGDVLLTGPNALPVVVDRVDREYLPGWRKLVDFRVWLDGVALGPGMLAEHYTRVG